MKDATSKIDDDIHTDLHVELISEFGWETEPWVQERLDRVMSRLNAARRAPSIPLTAISLNVPAMTAFTTPSTHIYVGRRLMERMGSDEMVALVLSHEIAHHDLGHLALFKAWMHALPRGAGTTIAAALFRKFEDELLGPEREAAADVFAIDLCTNAGYDVPRCIQAFTKLEQDRLNSGDVDSVYGPENLLDPTDPKRDSVAYAVQRWLWIRMHRYLPLHERRERAIAYYESKGAVPYDAASGRSST